MISFFHFFRKGACFSLEKGACFGSYKDKISKLWEASGKTTWNGETVEASVPSFLREGADVWRQSRGEILSREAYMSFVELAKVSTDSVYVLSLFKVRAVQRDSKAFSP